MSIYISVFLSLPLFFPTCCFLSVPLHALFYDRKQKVPRENHLYNDRRGRGGNILQDHIEKEGWSRRWLHLQRTMQGQGWKRLQISIRCRWNPHHVWCCGPQQPRCTEIRSFVDTQARNLLVLRQKTKVLCSNIRHTFRTRWHH